MPRVGTFGKFVQPPGLPSHLQVFACGDDDGSHWRSVRGDVCVGLGAAVRSSPGSHDLEVE